MASTKYYSSGEVWASAIETMYSGPESEAERIVRQLWAEDSKITIQGSQMTVEGIMGYVKQIRESYKSVEIKSLHWLRDGNLFAEKHIAIGHLKTGSTTEAEVCVMGGLNADGKAVWFEEMLRFISGSLDLKS